MNPTNNAVAGKNSPHESLRMKLARALDDNLHTRQWHNIVDWLIVAMILLSTAEIFLSTFDVDPRLRRVLLWVDIATLVFFTVEVSLRIWVAPLINPKFMGLKGRLRYCFTFYGAIDVLSTFPFYLQWIFPLPVAAFKMLRTARVVRTMRIGRYSKSFNLLSNAIREKRRELIVSMQFLILITLILSLVLFFAEHEAQPDVYENGFISVIWAFAQYIGDPGQFADTPPITTLGRIIACIVGLLGIAIVAVPAGIIGAGFTEALEKEAHSSELHDNAQTLLRQFQRKQDRETKFQTVPPLITMTQIQARSGLKVEQTIDVVNRDAPPYFRLVNTASTIPYEDKPIDMLAVEHYTMNRPYGLCIDRGSAITIINPSAYLEAGMGNFSFYLALIGGFNYISREIGNRGDSASFYLPPVGTHPEPSFEPFMDDVKRFLERPGSWGITTLVASGALEPRLPTHIHFTIGGEKGSEYDIKDPFITDFDKYKAILSQVTQRANAEFGYLTDHQQYHTSASERIFLRRQGVPKTNNIILRLEWDKVLWNPRRIAFAKMLAQVLCNQILGTDLPEQPLLKVKAVGFEDYFAESH